MSHKPQSSKPAKTDVSFTPAPVRPAAGLLPLGAALMAASLQLQAADAVEKTLAPVKVQADADIQQDGLRATVTRVGKTLQDPHDIPQAVTTVTNKIMEEQQVGSLREALRNVSGLTFNAAEGGRSGDNMMLRGFYTFGDMYLDGIRDTAQYNRETFNLEQVDVLRGSAAMLFGRGQAGGVINQVSKTPMLNDRNKLTASVGTERYLEQTADVNKHLGGSTALRINLMNRDDGSWRANPSTGAEPEVHRRGLAVSMGTGLTTDNEFILSHLLTTTRDKPDYGISFDSASHQPGSRLPNSTYFGVDANFDDSKTRISTATYTHRFAPGSEWRTQLRYADYERSYWAKTPNLTTPPNELATVGGNQTRAMDYETVTVQSDFSSRLQLAGMPHQWLTGVEYLREDSSRSGLYNFGATTAANPPQFLPYIVNPASAPTTFKADSYAVYAQDTVEFIPRWKATFGLRRDLMDASYSSASSPKLKYGEWSTRSALSFHPTEDNHYYLSVSDSFSPTADLYQLTSEPLPAERSKVVELGAKWMLLEGDLALRTALYRAEKNWERNTDLESTAALLSRKRHTNGLELEAAGRLSTNWELFAGLALMDASIDDQHDGDPLGSFASVSGNGSASGPTGLAGAGYATGDAADAAETVYRTRSQQVSEGQRPRNTPQYTFNLWSTYQFAANWKAGVGLEAKGERYGYGIGTCGAATQATAAGANRGKWSYGNCSTSFTPNAAPAYVRYDAMMAYERRLWAVRLNVQNLLNDVYYDSIYDNGGFTVPGTKRKLIVSGEYKF